MVKLSNLMKPLGLLAVKSPNAVMSPAGSETAPPIESTDDSVKLNVFHEAVLKSRIFSSAFVPNCAPVMAAFVNTWLVTYHNPPIRTATRISVPACELP